MIINIKNYNIYKFENSIDLFGWLIFMLFNWGFIYLFNE